MLQEMTVSFSKLEPAQLIERAQTQIKWLFQNAKLHVFDPNELARQPTTQRGRDFLDDLGDVYLAYHKGPPKPVYLVLEGIALNDAHEFRFASLFFEQLITILSNAGYRQLLEQQAHSDWLTNLGNYRSFERTLLQENAKERTLGLLVLNNLLDINAREGYMAGDLLLKRLGETLRVLLPERASAFRIGGATFALLVHPQRVEAFQEKIQDLEFNLSIVWQDDLDTLSLDLIPKLSRRLVPTQPLPGLTRKGTSKVTVHCGVETLRDTLQEASLAWGMPEHVHLIHDLPVGYAIKQLKRLDAPALVLTECRSSGYLHDLQAAKPDGLIVGKVQKEQILAGLERVIRGETFYLGPEPELYEKDLLPREREVWRLVALGKSNDEIAELLNVKCKTISNYITNLQEKLFVDGRTALALHYFGKLT